jgi:DNA-binding FadR family transcriptional regulator
MDLLLDAWRAFEELAFHEDRVVQHEAHVAFHRGLWVASQNTMLIRLWPVTEALITITLAEDQAIRADPARAHLLHFRLVQAIKSGDPAVIEHQLRHHTIDSAEELTHLNEH